MEDKQPEQQVTQAKQPVSIDDLANRLAILEKVEARSSDSFKWMFGIFVAVATVLLGGNAILQ